MNHFKCKIRNSNFNERGTLLLELALILPTLVLLALGTFELSEAIERHQVLSVASREAGNWAVRSCLSLPGNLQNIDPAKNQGPVPPEPRPITPTLLEGCLINIVDQVKSDIGTSVVSVEITLSIFTADADGNLQRLGRISTNLPPKGTKSDPPIDVAAGKTVPTTTRFNDAYVESVLAPQINDTNLVLVSEASTSSAGLIFKNIVPDFFYEATIF